MEIKCLQLDRNTASVRDINTSTQTMSFFQNTVAMIPAHDSPLAALSFNASATKLASASEKVNRSQTLWDTSVLWGLVKDQKQWSLLCDDFLTFPFTPSS